MSFPGRENVAAALFKLVDTSVGAVVGLVTSGRVFRVPTQVDASETPALFQLQTGEAHVRGHGGLLGEPPTRTMRFEESIYIATSQDPSVVPSAAMNDVLDAIQDAFAPSPATGQSPLFDPAGKLIALSARIDGEIWYGENLEGSGRNLLIVPVQVLLP